MTDIKFCGMTRAADVRAAADLGAAYVGCVFAGGPRHRTPAEAAILLEALAGAPSPRPVGVFAGLAGIRDTAVAVPLDIAQVHGDAAVTDVAALRATLRGLYPARDVWAVVRSADGHLPDDMAGLWAAADAVLLDASVPGKLGGTGTTLPWAAMAARVRQLRVAAGPGSRLVLAGGLTPANVGEAILALHPDVVDVSSGVERAPGIKDHDRMHAFAEAVRTADAALASLTPSPIP